MIVIPARARHACRVGSGPCCSRRGGNDASALSLAHSNTAGCGSSSLRKSYSKKLVIRDVSLDLEQGEVVALLGPNGSGKTTTFYAIAG